MFRSIRWNLLGWQAVILLAVVVGFGTTLFLRVRYATLEQVDADLLGAAQVVVAKLQQTGSAKQLEIPEAYRHRFGTAPADAPYWLSGTPRVECRSHPTPPPPIFGPARNFLRRKALAHSINGIEGRFEK